MKLRLFLASVYVAPLFSSLPPTYCEFNHDNPRSPGFHDIEDAYIKIQSDYRPTRSAPQAAPQAASQHKSINQC